MRYTNISIKKLLPTGPYKNQMNFSDSKMLSDFLGRSSTYVSAAIRNKKYIITDTLKNYYVIVSYNGNKVHADKKIQNFYDNHVWENGIISAMRPLVMPTKEQIQENKAKHVRVGKLLSRIQTKYGSLTNAESTKEFSELQGLLNTGRS